MDFNLFLSVLGWCGSVFFLFMFVMGIKNYHYYNSPMGLIGFVACVVLLITSR